MSSKKWIAGTAATAALIVAMTGCANNAGGGGQAVQQAGDAQGQQVRIMVGGLSKQIYLPFMLAEKLGYYKDAGISVQLSDEPAGVDAETNMLSGQVDGVGGFYDHNQVLQAKGKATEAVISMLQVPGEAELCRTDLKDKIKSAADWKGLNLGITDSGSSTDYLTQYIAKKNGIDPATTHRIGVQAGATFIAAMDHKNIDCGMTTEPTISNLVNSGKAFVLYDSRTLDQAKTTFGGAYPATSLYMSTAFVDSHKDLVQKLVNVYVKTLKYIQDNTAAKITDQLPPDYYAGVGKDAYVKALDSEKGMFNPTGIMPADGPKIVNDVLQSNPEVTGKSIDLSKTYTNEFVQAAK